MTDLDFNNNNDFILLFEKKLREYTNAPYVVLTDSCTNALFLCLINLNNKIIVDVPRKTYVSVGQAVVNSGHAVNYVDDDWNGYYNLGGTNIYDYAVNFKRDIYIPGTLQCLSFQQKKSIGIGKGGAILTDDKAIYLKLKRMAWDGRDPSISVNMDNTIHGYHMNMPPEDAVKGVLLLNQYKYNSKHIGNYMVYNERTTEI
jgi:dTDP-4-amino-4,6-dideoxygalactose transaminase